MIEKKKESGQMDYTQMRSDRSENTLIVYYKNKYVRRKLNYLNEEKKQKFTTSEGRKDE